MSHWGRCYSHVADGTATFWVDLFQLEFWDIKHTSSHMCGRWYLPMFLLRDGLFTLMYIAPLIVLIRFWSSLPTILKLSKVVLWPVILKWSYIREVPLRCSLNLSPSILDDSLLFIITLHPVTFVSLDDTIFLCDGILIFGRNQEVLMVLPPLKCACTPCFLHTFLGSHLALLHMEPPNRASDC